MGPSRGQAAGESKEGESDGETREHARGHARTRSHANQLIAGPWRHRRRAPAEVRPLVGASGARATGGPRGWVDWRANGESARVLQSERALLCVHAYVFPHEGVRHGCILLSSTHYY